MLQLIELLTKEEAAYYYINIIVNTVSIIIMYDF